MAGIGGGEWRPVTETDTKWRETTCPTCRGGGVIGFDGPQECPDCDGSGVLWVSPADRVARYPGGPFRGQWPGAYAEAREEAMA